ncbi:hypothetical protein [cf. Phormidesmis sp. LEGE 11477]|uniref:hypothetical protein n=1 Tax=cf. Phormidesmis sp. LEGE 11477 TaxID=1828680 RepID=UPI001882C4F0|nr:hypothetical protein [cf. Phormidesmis sp. LEGE 11477]MBE9062441.1 hypothetical protein [cf. Phormidesmis sp. LEGE 11477]
MTSLEAIELKFLLKLLGCENYRSKISEIKPNAKTKASDRDKVCRNLGAKGLVDYDSEVAKFKLTSHGKTLLSLDTTSLPATPDELAVMRACKGVMTPGQLRKTPAGARQQIIQDLAGRKVLSISEMTIKEVSLSAQGRQFLLEEYEPRGNSLVATATMLGSYIKFLRNNSGQFSQQPLPTSQPQPQRSLSQPSSSAMPIGIQSKPDAQAVLQQIKQLDQLIGSDNYLPIYHLREKLQPPLTREELDSYLYELQRADRIELSSLHNQDDYSASQISAGISQSNGGSLFFIAIL